MQPSTVQHCCIPWSLWDSGGFSNVQAKGQSSWYLVEYKYEVITLLKKGKVVFSLWESTCFSLTSCPNPIHVIFNTLARKQVAYCLVENQLLSQLWRTNGSPATLQNSSSSLKRVDEPVLSFPESDYSKAKLDWNLLLPCLIETTGMDRTPIHSPKADV